MLYRIFYDKRHPSIKRLTQKLDFVIKAAAFIRENTVLYKAKIWRT